MAMALHPRQRKGGRTLTPSQSTDSTRSSGETLLTLASLQIMR